MFKFVLQHIEGESRLVMEDYGTIMRITCNTECESVLSSVDKFVQK